jgi:hypothetical protein
VTKAPLAPPVREADDPEYATNLRRATLASTVGSALEHYDFALYGLASALIFSQLCRDLTQVEDALDDVRVVDDVPAGELVPR